MGFSSSLNWSRRKQCLLLMMMIVADWSLSSEKLVAQAGRVLPRIMNESGESNLSKASLEEREKSYSGKEVAAEKILRTTRIGSRPPACERRCGTCGRCEPVQVPAVPQERRRPSLAVFNINSRVEDNSNYKPMNWKCKCGDIFFNP